jgi:hypothetical protein
MQADHRRKISSEGDEKVNTKIDNTARMLAAELWVVLAFALAVAAMVLYSRNLETPRATWADPRCPRVRG